MTTNDLKITEIKITYPDNLIPFILDVSLFKEKFPDIYLTIKDNIQDMDLYEIEDSFPASTSFDSNLISTKYECILITMADGTTQSIRNIDIVEWHGDECDGYMIYSQNRYLYCILSRAAGQAGSLGIWDVQKKNWIFRNRDECFCIEAVVYMDKKDVFIAYCEWSSYVGGGNCFYLIKTDGSYQELENPEQCKNFKWKMNVTKERMRRFWNNDKYFLGYDESQDFFFTTKDNVRMAYILPTIL